MAINLQLAALWLLFAGHHVLGEYLNNELLPTGSADWSHHGTNGPEFWCNLTPPYPECCKKSQSPVDVQIDATKFPAYHLAFKNYDVTPTSMRLLNNGHTVVLTSQSSSKPSVSFHVRLALKVYELHDVHFHWGKVSSRGSEHTLNKAQAPMEMHFVHHLTTYSSLITASRNPESIAVVAVFFELSQHNNPKLNTLIDGLKLVKYANDDKPIPTFTYTNLLPSSRDYFFSYNGSLTTPPCSENVRWIVLNTKVPISEAQLQEFRQLQEKPLAANPNSAFPIVDNFRPLQNLNGRPIYRSKLF